MIKKNETVLTGADDRKFLIDYRYNPQENQPVVIFIHGFKGFKDWGHFNLLADYLAERGFAVIKFNFSHNGTTPDQPEDFADLEAFGKNTLGKELIDLQKVIDAVFDGKLLPNFDGSNLFLIAHSRGGAAALYAAARDERIGAVSTLASIADLETRFTGDQFKEWYSNGVIYIPNARTEQQMPMYTNIVNEYLTNRSSLDIPGNAGKLNIPHLIIHGTEDETVPLEEAEALDNAGNFTELFIVEGANHTFGGKHPYEGEELPQFTVTALDKSVEVFNNAVTGKEKSQTA